MCLARSEIEEGNDSQYTIACVLKGKEGWVLSWPFGTAQLSRIPQSFSSWLSFSSRRTIRNSRESSIIQFRHWHFLRWRSAPRATRGR